MESKDSRAHAIKVTIVFGTRPEAIKLAPLIKCLGSSPEFDVSIIATGQHQELLEQALSIFNIRPHRNLRVMTLEQGLASMTAQVLDGFSKLLLESRPDIVLVHGDTSSTLAATIASFYQGVPVGHVEAGLRSGNPTRPFPEEFNRRCTSLAATLHFAPTSRNAENLIKEGVDPASVFVTGNTVVDALQQINQRFTEGDYSQRMWGKLRDFVGFDLQNRRIVLVTGHRRENQESGLGQLVMGIRGLASKFPDVYFVYPIHPSPSVRKAVGLDSGLPHNFLLAEPMDYEMFLFLLSKSDLAITDSGGLQEEAPSFGVPVLLVREETERPEGLSFGLTELVQAKSSAIELGARTLLEKGPRVQLQELALNPFGQGDASAKIRDAIRKFFEETLAARP